MSDEQYEPYALDDEEVRAILDWAVSTGAMVVLMKHDERPPVEKLAGYEEAVDIMFNHMPECLENPAWSVAQASVEEGEAEDAEAEKFLKEIEEYEKGL